MSDIPPHLPRGNPADASPDAGDPPLGTPLPHWTPRPRPTRVVLEGRHVRLEPLDPARHADALFDAYAAPGGDRVWTYLAVGPFDGRAPFRAHLDAAAATDDPLHVAVVERTGGRALGSLALMRIDPANGVAEIGHVTFAPALQRTPMSTEAQFLLLEHLFDTLGYRRCEWKCNALNAPSRRAAERLGFRFEGLFRQALVVKGRNRDTAWYSIVDGEWPALRAAFERWLDPANLDAGGRQRASLPSLRDGTATDGRSN